MMNQASLILGQILLRSLGITLLGPAIFQGETGALLPFPLEILRGALGGLQKD